MTLTLELAEPNVDCDERHLDGEGLHGGWLPGRLDGRAVQLAIGEQIVPLRVYPVTWLWLGSDGHGDHDLLTALALARPSDRARLPAELRPWLAPPAIAFYLFDHWGDPRARWGHSDLLWPQSTPDEPAWSFLDEAIVTTGQVAFFDGARQAATRWPRTFPTREQLGAAPPAVQVAFDLLSEGTGGDQPDSSVAERVEAYHRAGRLGLDWHHPVERAIAERIADPAEELRVQQILQSQELGCP